MYTIGYNGVKNSRCFTWECVKCTEYTLFVHIMVEKCWQPLREFNWNCEKVLPYSKYLGLNFDTNYSTETIFWSYSSNTNLLVQQKLAKSLSQAHNRFLRGLSQACDSFWLSTFLSTIIYGYSSVIKPP